MASSKLPQDRTEQIDITGMQTGNGHATGKPQGQIVVAPI
ncbi:hypothetical protein ABIE60_000275 [Marinobacterium sp. MBR-109]